MHQHSAIVKFKYEAIPYCIVDVINFEKEEGEGKKKMESSVIECYSKIK
jgi:Trm5-related predicted tRNA methylase